MGGRAVGGRIVFVAYPSVKNYVEKNNWKLRMTQKTAKNKYITTVTTSRKI